MLDWIPGVPRSALVGQLPVVLGLLAVLAQPPLPLRLPCGLHPRAEIPPDFGDALVNEGVEELQLPVGCLVDGAAQAVQPQRVE